MIEIQKIYIESKKVSTKIIKNVFFGKALKIFFRQKVTQNTPLTINKTFVK